ncbi:swi5-dependent recombination DNA repair protein 1 homolog [Portunus trituberculatus]|uniref:swi5-dependent recombination DNA repair protein 1 homolog n=1 Tax=Portunus trituberculatus TaxID=210409 RepID=UPI001E1CE138|nr:swi5-dependent recombination DNA repair protein 1 homolog [Portunus trituberculatus]
MSTIKRNHQATTDLQTQTDSASQQSVEEPQDDLGDLQKEELVKIARNLRKELASSKSQLSCYRSVTAGLADKRVVLVEAVSIVDTLLATLASEGLVQQTVACTARPHKIVSETGETVTVGSGECDSFSSPSLTSPLSSSPNTPVPLSTIPNPLTPNTSVLLPTLSSPPTHSSPPNTSVPLPTLPTPPTPFSPPNTSVSSSTIPTPPTPSSPPKTSIPLLPSSSAQLNPPSSSTPPTPPTSLDIAALPHPTPSSNNTLPPNSQTPLPNPPQPPHTPEPPVPPYPASTLQQGVPQTRGEYPATTQSSSAGRQHRPKRKKRRNTATGRNSDSSESSSERRQQQSRQEVIQARQQQTKCPQCKRQGHTRDQCPRQVCDYCQGRHHSSATCRIRIADVRQQELVQAVRQSGQETLVALRSVAWQLPLLRHTRAPLTAPHSSSPPQWPAAAPAFPAHYGAGHPYYLAPPHSAQQ